MEVKEGNSATLSNYEVMLQLQQMRDNKTSRRGSFATIIYEALKYLESSACATQTPKQIQKCLNALEAYNLQKSEKLMLINTPPATELEIQLIVENSEERLSDTHVTEILNIIQAHMGDPSKDS